MLRKFLPLAALLASSPLAAAPATDLAQDAKAFGKRVSAWSVDISPSGNKVVVLSGGPAGSTVVRVYNLTSGEAKAVLGSRDSKEKLDWCGFATEDKLICRYSGNDRLDGKLIPFTRHMAVAADGSGMTPLGQKASDKDKGLRQFDGWVVDWLPNNPGSVLMARNYVAETGTTGSNIARSNAGLGVDRIELASMDIRTVEQPRDEIGDYMTDGLGNVRIAVVYGEFDQNLTGVTRYKYRKAGSRNWDVLGDSRSGMRVLAVEAATDSAYVLKRLNGRDALYRMKLDGTGAAELVASNPKVDISGVVRVGGTQKVIGYTYTDDQTRTVYFDPEYGELASSLGKALPKFPLINLTQASADDSKLLLYASSDTHPGVFMVLDRNSKKMRELAGMRPELEGRTLSPMKAISYAAADGTQIPAYLTIPAGSSGKAMPAVVLPHGGPSSRDEWGFDWLAQFFAARGYVVVQPNYRGSSGYGEDFSMNAFKNWRTAMSDIGDSARYLVKEGIADPNRIAIVGWSYGGYAALQSAAIEPALYKAAVAIAPVTDLAMLKKENEGYTNAKLVAAQIGSGPHVREGSPLQNAANIQVPVLLFHGDLDINVGIAQSEKMESALKKAGKRVEFTRYPGLDHELDDSNARADMLLRIGTALQAAIGN